MPKPEGTPGGGPKAEQLMKMTTKAQEQIAKMQALIDSGDLTEDEINDAEETIAAMMAKIERLTAKGA